MRILPRFGAAFVPLQNYSIFTTNVEQQMLLELFPSTSLLPPPGKLVFPPHSPPLNLRYFPNYVRNPDEVPSIQFNFFGIGVNCNDPIHCSHR